ncbi:MAG: murein hydrolase activator EnvC family protein [Gammaproteobacteria bacterium]
MRQKSAAGLLRRTRGLIVAALLLTPLASVANDAEQLQRLRQRIQSLQDELNDTRGQRDAVRDELQAQDRRIGELLRRLREIDARLAQDGDTLEALRRDAAAERTKLDAQLQALETQMRAAYTSGRQEPLKLVLNQESPAVVSRLMTYYRYLNAARVARVAQLRQTLGRIEDLQTAIGAQTRALAVVRDDRTREKTALEAAQRRRAELLAHLDQRVRNQSDEIARLKTDEQRLERLLREIKSYTLPTPPGLPSATRFAHAKGRLPLPSRGRVLARYGDAKHIGDLTWRGIFLGAPEGSPVHAVFRGRVAYADWLRGFGLLLILDHGDGYMTLYGHNQTLHRQVGDWVEAGQPIAAAGRTGDAPASGVYFEIRHNGKPNDPLQWCALGRASGARARK